MADPVGIARGVMGGARAAAPKNFAQEYNDLLKIFTEKGSESQRALAREAAEKLYQESLQNFKMTVPASKGQAARVFDISPNAPNLVVRMPSGAIIEIPRNANIPQGAQVLNKSADELRAMIPAEIRPAAPPPTTSVPIAGTNPLRPEPPAPRTLSTAPFGPRPVPTKEPDLGLPLGAAGLAGTGGILAAQRGDIYAGGQRTPTGYLDADDDRAQYPLDPALVQRQILQNLPVYRGPAVDEVRSPPEPGPAVPYLDADDDRAMAFRERLGSVGPAGSLPMMARRGGGEGQYTAVIDPSILMLARERLMPYSMRGAEGRVASESAPAVSSARTGAAGPRAASSTSATGSPAGGFLSGLFKDPYEGQSSRQLYETYQKRGDDDPAMFARAARKELEERKAAGLARGGSAGSEKHGKDAAVMKALEIIHHMLSNR